MKSLPFNKENQASNQNTQKTLQKKTSKIYRDEMSFREEIDKEI